MPSRNTVRSDAPETYYHVYARGVNKSACFLSADDKEYFLHLLSRHLSINQVRSKQGYLYPHFRDRLELLAYCLMDNHFHLLFYQVEQGSLSAMMQSVMVAYTAYFNRSNKRSGPLFESRFKAAAINRDGYLLHISRYIHLNPRSWKNYPHSSLVHIRKAIEPEWLQTTRLLSQHASREKYLEFVADYDSQKQMLNNIKQELADA